MRQVLPFGKFYGVTRQQTETQSFAFAVVEDFVNHRVPLHTHENAHFCFIVRGEFETRLKDKKQSCSASTMLFHPSGTTHDDHFYAAGGKFLTVSLTSEANKKLLEEISFFDYSTSFDGGEIACLGKRICRELQSPDSLSSIVLESMANELMVYAARSLKKSVQPPVWLKTAYELLHDRCRDELTVAEIAADVGVHPLHLARTFRKFFGSSPGEYLRKCRLESATRLLLDSKKSLVEIALESGFGDQSQFTRSFKQYAGVTPAKFRKVHCS